MLRSRPLVTPFNGNIALAAADPVTKQTKRTTLKSFVIKKASRPQLEIFKWIKVS